MALQNGSLNLCINSQKLTGRILRVAQEMRLTVRQIDSRYVQQVAKESPTGPILVFQDDVQFAQIIGECQRADLAIQDVLIRLVDGSDDVDCGATSSPCEVVRIPSCDIRLRECIQQLAGRRGTTVSGQRNPNPPGSVTKSGAPTESLRVVDRTIRQTTELTAIADVNHPVYATARRIAPAQVDVVLIGETGTGKDWLARYIHDHSGARGPFIAVNCPAIPETLAEAELFGVDAGAYTGATKSRAGRIEAAHGGTLYLDEIDSMPLMLQAKLLRVLQERGVERVGSTLFRQLSFRVIVSTKVPLAKLVEEEKFRADLYYRLSVVELTLPVMRHQPARTVDLFWRYVDQAAHQFAITQSDGFGAGVDAQILAHAWKGNIRELRAAAQRYALGFPLLAESGDAHPAGSLKEMMNQYERALLTAALERCNRNVSRAAKDLGVESHVLYYKLKTLGIHIASRSDAEVTGSTGHAALAKERMTKSRTAD